MNTRKKIGIIGGGQLALMMIQENPKHYYYVLEPKKMCSVNNFATIINKSYNDIDALMELQNSCDVITYEFENIASDALKVIRNNLYPNPDILTIAQNRITEKEFAKSLKIPTPVFFKINNLDQLIHILDKNILAKWILKTTVGGYDGKGQIMIKNNVITEDIKNMVNSCECILEEVIDFEFETSLIMTRNKLGEFVYLPPTTNIHKNNILSVVHNFNKIKFEKEMVNYTKKIMDKLNVIGTLAVEFFITKTKAIFNEMAPRPHNSGHWSIEGTNASQFINHINAVINNKLITPKKNGYTAMINLLGNDITNAKEKIKFDDNVILHDYFKDKIMSNRKMGHITINFKTMIETKNMLNEILKKIF